MSDGIISQVCGTCTISKSSKLLDNNSLCFFFSYNNPLGQKSLRFLVGFKVGAVTRLLFFFFSFFLPTSEICILLFSHVQSMVAKRGRTNWANIHAPM